MQKTNKIMELVRNTRHYLSTNSNVELGLSKDDFQNLIFLLDLMLKSRINDDGIPHSINHEQLSFIERMISNNDIDRVLRFRLTDIMSAFDDSKAMISMETSHNVNFYNNAAIEGKIKQLEKRQSALLKELDDISNKNAKILSDYERKITLLFNKKTEEVDNFFSERTRSETERLNKYETDITEVINNAQHAINARAHESEKNLINSMNVAQVHAIAELS
jgi:predicted subunit of tRNA(5-methylaminomethyl-2-thiouridylate) methyltransferase